MASRADQMASSISFAKFSQATDLKKRLWFTLGALIVFRFLSFVPLPGIDPTVLSQLYVQTKGGILDIFNTFSVGSLERMSLIARSEEHKSELQSLMRSSYAVFCLQKKNSKILISDVYITTTTHNNFATH